MDFEIKKSLDYANSLLKDKEKNIEDMQLVRASYLKELKQYEKADCRKESTNFFELLFDDLRFENNKLIQERLKKYLNKIDFEINKRSEERDNILRIKRELIRMQEVG